MVIGPRAIGPRAAISAVHRSRVLEAVDVSSVLARWIRTTVVDVCALLAWRRHNEVYPASERASERFWHVGIGRPEVILEAVVGP